MVRDSRILTDECEYFDPLTSLQKEKAARVVCGYPGVDAEAADELMQMLGIHPDHPEEDEYLSGLPAMNKMVTH